jgi:hypothetical protein
MSHSIVSALWVIVMVAVVLTVDILWLRASRWLWLRFAVNVTIVTLFGVAYLVVVGRH